MKSNASRELRSSQPRANERSTATRIRMGQRSSILGRPTENTNLPWVWTPTPTPCATLCLSPAPRSCLAPLPPPTLQRNRASTLPARPVLSSKVGWPIWTLRSAPASWHGRGPSAVCPLRRWQSRGEALASGRDARAIDRRYRPIYAVWEVTLACDLACRHCGSRAGKERPDELRTAEALDLIDQMARLGVKEVTLIGGEAYLRDDWLELVRAIRSHGIPVTTTSGGRG